MLEFKSCAFTDASGTQNTTVFIGETVEGNIIVSFGSDACKAMDKKETNSIKLSKFEAAKLGRILSIYGEDMNWNKTST